MKSFRNVIATLALACALAINAYGGDQHTPAMCEGPNCPPPCTTECEATATSDSNETVALPADESDYLYETLMALLSVY